MRALIVVWLALALTGCGKHPRHDAALAGLYSIADLGVVRGSMTTLDLDYLLGEGGWTEGDFILYVHTVSRAQYARSLDDKIAKDQARAEDNIKLDLSPDIWTKSADRHREYKEKHAARVLSEYELVARALRADNLIQARDLLRKTAREGLGKELLGEE